MVLLNPHNYEREHLDPRAREIMLKTIAFFEKKGLASIKEDDKNFTWYEDYIDFIGKEEIFADLLTPAGYGREDARWDLWRVAEFNEVSGFYALHYQYLYQVTILGLGPIFLGNNEAIKHKAAALLREGAIFGFGLSERDHGNDIYADEMTLYPNGDGTYLAKGNKYYIGNGNQAALLSVFGKMADTGEYVFFVVDPQQPQYELVKKIDTQGAHCAYVAEFNLNDYPVSEGDIVSRGSLAWDSALNTVNIGKCMVGWASIGEATHALYECLHHTCNRVLYGKPVYAFPHVRRLFTESYLRLITMKLYALRCMDYFRSASDEDRRYLMYNAILKMKVCSQGDKISQMLLDLVGAKGMEQDTFMEMFIRDAGMMPRLEGTTHVNMALVNKFYQSYFFNPADFAPIPKRNDMADDDYVFKQKAGGLKKVRFGDYRLCYEGMNQTNVLLFREQVEALKEFLVKNAPTAEQASNVDYMIALGELLAATAYAQLTLENIKIYHIEDEVVEEIFAFMIRDFAAYALMFRSTFVQSPEQIEAINKMIIDPSLNPERFEKVWTEKVLSLKDAYVMSE
ncbi:Acyl-CoA dehydrogenase/oxidase C-terminal [Syntrophomonas zehnderi OL-4]|uniref:Acyl-CoA dehydrogenase/oxidase C-terminal n=1 Tax=Syntrophomonas zehnderi OL-4 TaxID=690567 RepID=A0A0E4C7D3_9FIRM|nr:acyl-CoA dehydrogenase [Syntrophomonas zehnderi]CFW97472.1 Acyl-CoA dehydrogenase/oxidase C-terminal [Syntrophomonas zehnderi OL-4]